MNDVQIRTLQVPGANLHYEIRGAGPLLLMIPGAPADAGALAGLAAALSTRYTVITYDQRGLSRSPLTGPARDQDVAVFTEDAHRLLTAHGDGPAYVLGNSGGALTALDLVVRHPEQVRALVAHEPPIPEILPDRERWRAVFQNVQDTYHAEGPGAAMQKFLTTIEGEPSGPPQMPDFSQMPPEALEMMGRIQGNIDFFLAHVLLPVLRFVPDLFALRSSATRIAVGVGAASPDGVPSRSALALAEHLGTEPIEFPGDHQGLTLDPTTSAGIVHDAFTRLTRDAVAPAEVM
ncbi:putative hydrolase YraK [Planomonospora parontospora subsp. parontospora]|uniref:Hydrolase YraK n=2 Tax=Planomonospora parontospora TaxID=58119 RepID=A0AA37BNA5_9ACTN|nr:alpha/beta hydrolase [Planomonospora parontospora]GGK94730.1 putative hydrolase YraK [Planomonospora parontospora]GII11107.1 putative hydrolase YraK [Planomonospora parontospora subsp. parontospora]